MSLLIDKFRRDRWHTPFLDEAAAQKQYAHLLPLMAKAVVLEATNVGEWMYGGTDQEYWEFNKDYPNVAPPWPVFWIELRRPHFISSEKFKEDQDPNTLPERWGCLFEAEQKEDGSGWTFMAWCFMEHQRQLSGPLFEVMAEVDAEGHWIDHPSHDSTVIRNKRGPGDWGFMVPLPDNSHESNEMVFEYYFQSVRSLFLAPLMAVSFCHFRNVGIETQHPDEKVAKKHKRRHGFTPKSHHTLQIGGVTQLVDDQAASSGVGRVEALHIVRGHFKTYTEDAPLMGKHTGTYWWGHQLRGQSDAGIVSKDYAMKGPNDGSED